MPLLRVRAFAWPERLGNEQELRLLDLEERIQPRWAAVPARAVPAVALAGRRSRGSGAGPGAAAAPQDSGSCARARRGGEGGQGGPGSAGSHPNGPGVPGKSGGERGSPLPSPRSARGPALGSFLCRPYKGGRVEVVKPLSWGIRLGSCGKLPGPIFRTE